MGSYITATNAKEQCHQPGRSIWYAHCNGEFLEALEDSVPLDFFPSDFMRTDFDDLTEEDPLDYHGSDLMEEGPLDYHGLQGIEQRSRGSSGYFPDFEQSLEATLPFFPRMYVMPIEQNLGEGLLMDSDTGSMPTHGNIGDYFFGDVEQLIRELAENDPNRYGAPPASKSVVEDLPTIYVCEEQLGTECTVCKDELELGSQVKQMPCKHLYHLDCILRWLAERNTCPVCRHELPTDDPDYEEIRLQGAAVTYGNAALRDTNGEEISDGFSNQGVSEQFIVGISGQFTCDQQNVSGFSGHTQGHHGGGSRGSRVGTGSQSPSIGLSFFTGTTTAQSPENSLG